MPEASREKPAAAPSLFFHTPLLRAINVSIAIFIVALLFAVYWYGWRILPKTSGAISAPISSRAAIARDARGVPHITAGSWQDALFLQGYATAQDRLWQMDALRRLAGGELAEVIGKQALESDQEARRWRIARIAEQLEKGLTPDSLAILAAYARGVNYYIETHRDRLPVEFTLLNYQPRPWRVRDSLMVALHLMRTLTASWREEMSKYQMLESGDPAKVDFLYPRRAGPEIMPGSNAWVISGAHSITGKPILANDPHLEWSLPGAWYLVHLQAPGLDVSGASLPGVPAVIIGHNQRIAWGATNLGFDIQDLYQEQIDMRTGRYLYQGKIEQARLERDLIQVKGAKAVPYDTWVTRHGPIFVEDRGRQFAMQWLPATETTFDFPFLDLDRAQNWAGFNAALERLSVPAQNWIYADVDGNIGYHVNGQLPIHKNCAPNAPMDGASGNCEWDGFIPYDDLPQAFNPPSGIIATANQDPFPAGYAWPVDGRFAPVYRVQEIRRRLGSRAKWAPADMLGIEKDVYSPFSAFLAKQIVAAWDKHPGSNPQARDAVDLLRTWNGQMEKGTAAPMVIQLAYDQVRQAVAGRASARYAANYERSFLAPEIVERLLRQRPADWFKDFDALLVKSLEAGVAEGVRRQGSKVSRWDYGQYNQLTLESPVAGRLPLIGKYFDIGPVPMSGSGTTIKQTTSRLGPSLRMIVDLSDLDRSLENITTGESGNELSFHYKDQWAAYYGGTSFPMQFDHVKVSQTLTVNPQ